MKTTMQVYLSRAETEEWRSEANAHKTVFRASLLSSLMATAAARGQCALQVFDSNGRRLADRTVGK